MESYVKKRMPIGYVLAEEVLPAGTPITIRTLEAKIERKNLYSIRKIVAVQSSGPCSVQFLLFFVGFKENISLHNVNIVPVITTYRQII